MNTTDEGGPNYKRAEIVISSIINMNLCSLER